MGANVSYSVSKSRAYPMDLSEAEITTPLKNIPGFSEFSDHVYFLNPSSFGVIKVPLSTPLETYLMLQGEYLLVIGDVNDSSNWIPLLLVSLVFLGFAYYMYSKQNYLFAFLSLFVVLLLFLVFYSPKTSPDTTTTLEDALLNSFAMSTSLQDSSSLQDLSRIAVQVSKNTFFKSQLNLGEESSAVPGLMNATANETLDFVEIEPDTATPLHTHPSNVHALALSDNLEYLLDGREWKNWRKGQIVFIPKNIKHTIRNIGNEVGSFLSTLQEGVSPLHNFEVA